MLHSASPDLWLLNSGQAVRCEPFGGRIVHISTWSDCGAPGGFRCLHAGRLLQPPLVVRSAALEAGGNACFSGCICVFACVQVFAGGVWWLGRMPPAVAELLRLSGACVQLLLG